MTILGKTVEYVLKGMNLLSSIFILCVSLLSVCLRLFKSSTAYKSVPVVGFHATSREFEEEEVQVQPVAIEGEDDVDKKRNNIINSTKMAQTIPTVATGTCVYFVTVFCPLITYGLT